MSKDEPQVHSGDGADPPTDPAAPDAASIVTGEVVADATEAPAPVGSLPSGLVPDYDDAGQPSLEYVRDRVEARYATSLGTAELAGETPQAETLEEQIEERDRAAKDRLEQIRQSLRGDEAP